MAKQKVELKKMTPKKFRAALRTAWADGFKTGQSYGGVETMPSGFKGSAQTPLQSLAVNNSWFSFIKNKFPELIGATDRPSRPSQA